MTEQHADGHWVGELEGDTILESEYILLLAWPVAFYFMSQWLNRFAYQAPFAEWAWLFLASALAALAVAWLTIALQASKAASSRPVLALRYE